MRKDSGMAVKICVAITGREETEIYRQAEAIAAERAFPEVSVVELRYDLASELPAARLLPVLSGLRIRLPGKLLLFTIRTAAQGGAFPADGEYENCNLLAIRSGCIDMVDVELRREGYAEGRPSAADRSSTAHILSEARDRNVRSIASYHDFARTPEDEVLRNIFTELRESGADILKAAYMPECEEDVLRLMLEMRRFREADRNRHEYIAMSMGRLGSVSRLAGMLSGSDYSFMAVGAGSAPGQLSLGEGAEMLRILEENRGGMPFWQGYRI